MRADNTLPNKTYSVVYNGLTALIITKDKEDGGGYVVFHTPVNGKPIAESFDRLSEAQLFADGLVGITEAVELEDAA
jgi:hypothetical protein